MMPTVASKCQPAQLSPGPLLWSQPDVHSLCRYHWALTASTAADAAACSENALFLSHRHSQLEAMKHLTHAAWNDFVQALLRGASFRPTRVALLLKALFHEGRPFQMPPLLLTNCMASYMPCRMWPPRCNKNPKAGTVPGA